MTKKQSPLRVVPLGGLGEIGLNCMVFEYEDEIIVADCGVMFSDLQMLGVDFVIPDMTYLKNRKEKIKGYVITHAHEDHIGALPYALKNHPAPIYCTAFARKLIENKIKEHDLQAVFHELKPGEQVSFKHFKVKPVPVNHSIIEALALFIETPHGMVVFTGDFKFDATPFYGKPLDSVPFKEAGDKGVLLLMSDSTNVERDGHSLSEKRIYHKFEELFQKSDGLTIISVFASNIARIGQVLEVAAKLKKKVAFMGFSMEQNSKAAYDLGYLPNLHEVVVPLDNIGDYERKDCIVLSTGSQGEYRSALVRLSNDEHRSLKIGPSDTVILSSKFIPGNEKAIGRMINSLFRLGADVLYESVADIHVSGHANAGELRAMLNLTRPKFFIPVHGEYRHLVKHRKLAVETNVKADHALIVENGHIIEVTPEKMVCIEKLEENRVLVEGSGGKDISKVIIKDRRKVAEAGIVFSVLIRNSVSGKIIGGPDIFSRGLFEPGQEKNLFEQAKSVVNKTLSRVDSVSKDKSVDVQEEIRIELRRFFNAKLGKKPVVLPIIVDV